MKTLIKAGTLFTAASPSKLQHQQGILIEGELIKAVDDWEQFSPESDTQVIDAGLQNVFPGLIDAHVHITQDGSPDDNWLLNAVTEKTATTTLKAARNAFRHLEMGVTTIRDLGASDWIDIALRNAINEGWQIGPRILAAGHGITATGGHMDQRKGLRSTISPDGLGTIGIAIDGPYEARRAVREQIMGGADVIKINATLSEYVRALGLECSPELTLDEIQTICEVAHNCKRRVAAHCHGGPGVSTAIEAGVDTLEHGRFLTDEQLDEMAKRNVYLVPTLSPEGRTIESGIYPEEPADLRWTEKAIVSMYKTVERAYKRGVKIAAGSDAGMPRVYHGQVSYEINQLVKAGLSNQDALLSATRVAAETLGIEKETGSIAPGLFADLIILNRNPINDLTVLQEREHVLKVFSKGQLVLDRGK
ncbi:MAG: amidohydrolase family protein [Anaerolineaceae bacterium]|nr:amidohydrolase family protein [Anaerolineaceae bacterium]